jgi:hypothetical protein
MTILICLWIQFFAYTIRGDVVEPEKSQLEIIELFKKHKYIWKLKWMGLTAGYIQLKREFMNRKLCQRKILSKKHNIPVTGV